MRGLALLWVAGLSAALAQAQSADLVINHSDSPDPVPAGGIVTYTLRVDNGGPDAAASVTLDDILPTGATFVDVVTTAGACAYNAGEVNCTLGTIPFNASQTVTIRARLPGAGVWGNTAVAGSSTSDPNPTNNSSSQSTTALGAANLALTAAPSIASVAAGQPYSYALTVNNQGPDVNDGSQRVTFTVPSGASITAVPTGAGWACTPNSGYPLSSGSVSCTHWGPLAVGADAPVLTVPAVANENGTITAAFAVEGFTASGADMPDGDLANNTAVADVSSSAGADVSITKTPGSGAVAVGSNVTYILRPRLNGGISLASQQITVTDTLGAGLSFVSASGPGWTCDNSIVCTRPGYAGANYTNMPDITVVATAMVTGTVSNTASVATSLPDPVPGNNQSTSNLSSTNEADLRMTKTASANPVAPGVPYNYALTVRNLGPTPVPAGQVISVSDVVPAGVTLDSLVSAPGWTCDPLPFVGNGAAAWGCTRSDGLAVNANANPVTVSATMTSAGSAPNQACVALGGGARTDSNASNNCSAVTVAATSTTADLQMVSKTANPNPVVVGQDLTYTIVVQNNGPDVATDVVVTDVLTSLMASGGLRSATATQGSCTPSGVTDGASQTVTCSLGTLGVNASATVTLVVHPDAAVSGTRSNTASVRSTSVGDPNTGNNSQSVTSNVTALADLRVTKTATPATVPVGAPLTYVASVASQGPSDAQGVQLVDALPANAAFINLVSVSGGGTCNAIAAGAVGATLTCNWGTIVEGAQQTVTYRVRPLGSAAGGSLVNSVSASTTTLETNTANNLATTTTAVSAPQLDLLINRTDSVDPVVLGQSVVYTLTVTNSGPSYGTNVVVTDAFPSLSATSSATFSYQGSLTVDSGGTCIPPAVGATSGTLRCTFPGLSGGQSATIIYSMRAEALTGVGANSGTAFVQATVSVDEQETSLANNTITSDTTARRFIADADLQIAKTGPAGPLTPGDTVVYTVVVTNHGPQTSDGAQVVDQLPSGLNFVSAVGCVNTAGRVTCAVGSLAAGATRSFSITAQLASPYTGARPLVNSATIDALGDPSPGNNTSSTSATVAGDPANTIPTLSQWGLLLLAGLLALLAVRQRAVR